MRDDVAMTGEMTLTGQVLPIGGLKEKALAAQRAGIRRIIAPRRNEADLEDIPEHLRTGMDFVWVGDVGEVFDAALTRRHRPPLTAPASRVCSLEANRRGEVEWQAKKKAPKAQAAALKARYNPYVQRVIEDEDLRDNLVQAYESARKAYGRLSNGKSPTKQIFDDKKLQKEIKKAAASVTRRERRAARGAARSEAAAASASCWCSASSARAWRSRSARTCARRCSTRCSAPRRSSSTPPRRPPSTPSGEPAGASNN